LDLQQTTHKNSLYEINSDLSRLNIGKNLFVWKRNKITIAEHLETSATMNNFKRYPPALRIHACSRAMIGPTKKK